MQLSSQHGIRILHVDDDSSISELTATFLEREDDRFTVETATSADEGLQRITDRPPDCVVSDYNMPGLDGIEFLQAVREEHPDMPFILFTGKGSEAVASDAIAADVTDYLQKGSGSETYELLANRIRNAVQARRETQRAEKQEQLIRLTEFTGDTGGFELDTETNTVVLTAGTRRIIGRHDQHEMPLEAALKLFDPDDREDIQHTLDTVLETREELHDIWRLQPGDAEERLLEMTITPVVENGEVTKLRGAGHDITERKKYERTARQRQQQLSLFFEESPLGAVQWDDAFQFERVNGRAEEILGYSEAELRGESWEGIVAGDDRRQVGDAVKKLLDADGGTHVINRNVRQDGEVITCEWHNRAVTDADGTVQTIFSKFQDVTDRERRKTELQEYETIIEALSDAAYVLDEEGQFTYVNDELVELVGYDRETILGNTPSLIKDEASVQRAEQELGRLLSSHGPDAVTFEVTIHPREGDPVVCEDHMGILPYEGEQFNGSVGTLREITDRKVRERELEAVKSQYQTLIESYPDGAIFLYDTDLRVVRAGGSELSEVGFSLEEIEGTTPQDRYSPEIAEELVGNIENALAGESHTFEQEYRGEHYRIQTVPVRTGDGEITHAMAVSQNITDQVADRAELERRNDLFGKAQDIAAIGAWAHDTESGTLTWTDQVYEMHGVSKEFEPSVDNLLQFYHPEDRPKLREAVDQATTEGEPYDLEVRMTATGDGNRWFRTVADPQIENGDVVRVRGIVHDITDRVEREQELRQYKHFFENSPDQIALLDEDLTVQHQSPPSSLHELDAIEVEGENPLEYVHPDDWQTLSNHFEHLLKSPGGSFSEEFRAKDVSGEWRWVETRAINLLDEEPADGILAMIRDVTQQKRQRLKLERQNDRLDEFASIVSHDLRSPLSVVGGRLELAQETCESDHLAEAADALTRSQALIDDLLKLAREGETVGKLESVALADVAERSWQTVETGSATLETHATRTLRADRSRLKELVANLYRNAIEHGGDDVTVSVGAMDDGFYVADTGPGIPDSDREEVFEAGYSTNEDGTGFGLRIVEQIVDAHGWEVAITESEQGGARFEVTGVEFADR